MELRSWETIRVLHVDDEPGFRDLSETLLTDEDSRFEVETATSATEGLAVLAETEIDCIVSDYDMPEQNGIEFLEAVREREPELPFILFTGKGSEEIAGKAISAGVTDYLQKEGSTDQYTVLANRIANAVEHYRSRQRAERSERRLREIIDALPHLLYVVDEDGTYRLANSALARFHGTTVGQVEGAHVSDVLGAREAERFEKHLRAVLDSKTPQQIPEVEITDPYGQSHIFSPRMLPYDPDGSDVEAVLGIAVDVTDRKERERQLTAFLENTENAIYIKNDRGEYQLANDALAEMAGMEREELVGSHVSDVFGEEGAQRSVETDQRVIESGEPVTEEAVRTVGGKERIFLTEKFPFYDTDGTITGVMGVSRDITERKRQEQKLKEQRDNLDILNQVLRHDIRNDLQVVIGCADTLTEHVDDEGQEYLETLIDSADQAVEFTIRARNMSDAMLTTPDDRSAVHLQYVIETELEEVRTAHPAAEITTTGSISSAMVLADDLLDSVFQNLLKNAIQHNDKEVPEVTVSTTERADTVVVRVADNGPGIPDEKKDAIFAKDESGFDSDGTGIGLYLVKTLVDNYGGEIWVEDNDPEGAVFAVELQTVE